MKLERATLGKSIFFSTKTKQDRDILESLLIGDDGPYVLVPVSYLHNPGQIKDFTLSFAKIYISKKEYNSLKEKALK